MDPSIYLHNKLCFLDDMECTYPCNSTISSCKLIIHDKSFDGGNFKFNEASADVDFRIESKRKPRSAHLKSVFCAGCSKCR